jgi:hypothetical protein
MQTFDPFPAEKEQNLFDDQLLEKIATLRPTEAKVVSHTALCCTCHQVYIHFLWSFRRRLYLQLQSPIMACVTALDASAEPALATEPAGGEARLELRACAVHSFLGRPPLTKALFTSPIFSSPKNAEICGDLVFTQYSQISSNTLPQKYSTMMESF